MYVYIIIDKTLSYVHMYIIKTVEYIENSRSEIFVSQELATNELRFPLHVATYNHYQLHESMR